MRDRTEQNITNLKFELKEETLPLSTKFKKSIPLRRNVFQMKDYSKNAMDFQPRVQSTRKESEFQSPQRMESTMMSYLFIQRVASSVSVFSLILSLVQVYGSLDQQKAFYIIGHCLTVFLTLLVSISHHLNRQKGKARGQETSLGLAKVMITIMLILPHPTAWTEDYNHLLHLALTARLLVPYQYIIRSSSHHNSRGYRLIRLYGIDSSEHFYFSFKSIMDNLKIYQVLTVYIMMALAFSHCLYLVGNQSEVYRQQGGPEILAFMDCFQIVIVTMPTVGYGEYQLVHTGQRIVVFFILLFSAAFNSFITISMLKLLEMAPREISSYRLQKKLAVKGKMEDMSREYIIETIRLIKRKQKDIEYRQQLDYTFSSSFRQLKAIYDSLNNNEIDKNFTYFRESLHDLYIKNCQTNQMVDTLLRRLIENQGRVEHMDKKREAQKCRKHKRTKADFKMKKQANLGVERVSCEQELWRRGSNESILHSIMDSEYDIRIVSRELF